ncbi:MAG: neutral zinc metallopeptidase [Myxococcota bacterium]
MKWTKGYRSRDTIDRRGASSGGGGGLGGAGLSILAQLLPRLGWKGMLLVLAGMVVFGLVSGSGVLGGLTGTAPVSSTEQTGPNDDPAAFVSFVLDDAQTTWTKLFQERGATYAPAKLVLFTNGTDSACGYGAAAVGPFYCPNDTRVYIDLSFYDDLAKKYGAPGDFAEAYVIAHEIGHHVQNQRGELGGKGNEASVRQELQADCYAGVWARSAGDRGLLEPGDVEEGIGAAAAVGDDRLQKAETGRVTPESFTHGSAAQRTEWFRRGYTAGAPEACDTSGA